MWTYEHTVETEAPPEAIWRLWADVSTWSRWDDDIEWATLDGPFAVGSRGRLKPNGIPAGGFTLVSVVPGTSYVVQQRLPLATLRFHHELGPAGRGLTSFTHRVTIDGPLGRLYASLFGRRMKANFGTIMRHLAADAEAEAAACGGAAAGDPQGS
jgi:polyketide cyclase/dehydrase/lipid transport protein